jgi:predicted transposase YbfD/YdcC
MRRWCPAKGAVEAKSNGITAIPALLERLAAPGASAGALITIGAIACNPGIAQSIVARGAGYLLAVKGNQPSLLSEIERFFDDAPGEAVDRHLDVDKGHGRIEERRCTVSRAVDWMDGEYRFPKLSAIAMAAQQGWDQAKHQDRTPVLHRRAHWRIGNALHWVPGVTLKDDLSRVRKGHGAKNMAVVRHFAINLIRQAKDKKRLKLRRKIADGTRSISKPSSRPVPLTRTVIVEDEPNGCKM